MTLSKQLFLLFFFPLVHASKPKKCSTSSDTVRCGPSEVPIRFPFCDHPGFSLHCNHLCNTVLQLPLSGSFLVRNIDYTRQQIYISDPQKCLAKRLLTFNISGSPFSSSFDTDYMFFTCPNEAVLPSTYRFISCLSNSTSSFFAVKTTFQVNSTVSSCQFVKRLYGPDSFLTEEKGLSNNLDNQSFWLEWHSPNCSSCEMKYMRCGLKNKASLEVKCFRYKTGLSNKAIIIIISVTAPIGIILFSVCLGGIGCYVYHSESSDSNPQQSVAVRAASIAQQPREIMATRGLDRSTIESYKKMELGENRRLPGSNDIVCPICLSEYASKETVRCLPNCEHCFHIECIDEWLKIHGSCPVCRNLPSLPREAV